MNTDVEYVVSFRIGSTLNVPENQRFITLRYGDDGIAYVNKEWTMMVCVRVNMRCATLSGVIDSGGKCYLEPSGRTHYTHTIIVHLRSTNPCRYNKNSTMELLDTFCSHPYDMGHTQKIVVPPCLSGQTILFKDGAIFYDDTQILDLIDAYHSNLGIFGGAKWAPELPYLVHYGSGKYLEMIYGTKSSKEMPRRRNAFIAQALEREGSDILGDGEPPGSPHAEVSEPMKRPRRKRKRKEKEEEKKKAKIFSECKICMDKDKTVLFEPCMHLCCCKECSRLVKNCPICRSRIRKKVDVFVV